MEEDLEHVNLGDKDLDSGMVDLLILTSKIERFRLSEQVLSPQTSFRERK
jgi:hypothetical protein